MEVLPIIRNVNYGQIQKGDNYESFEYSESSPEVMLLARKLEEELRAVKSTHLACGEVLLPCGLLPQIAKDVLALADKEPRGIKGCTLHLSFESDQECRKLSTILPELSTFEVFITLKQDQTSWHNILPQFLKNLTKGGTVMISSTYTLEMKRPYQKYYD